MHVVGKPARQERGPCGAAVLKHVCWVEDVREARPRPTRAGSGMRGAGANIKAGGLGKFWGCRWQLGEGIEAQEHSYAQWCVSWIPSSASAVSVGVRISGFFQPTSLWPKSSTRRKMICGGTDAVVAVVGCTWASPTVVVSSVSCQIRPPAPPPGTVTAAVISCKKNEYDFANRDQAKFQTSRDELF